MNELIKSTLEIQNCSAEKVAPQIMVMCRAVTPQFYRNMSDADIQAEKLSIQLLTTNIDQQCLAEMCRVAVLNYPLLRSENSKAYFDINYILTFYKQVFNKMYCESVHVPKGSECISREFDITTHIVTEKYKTPTGEIVTIREIKDSSEDASKHRVYSSKGFQLMFDNYDDDWSGIQV